MKCDRMNASAKMVAIIMLAVSVGCKPDEPATPSGDSNSSAAVKPAKQATGQAPKAASRVRHAEPKESVAKFLEALRSGDDQLASSMLTSKAQEEMARTEAAIKPPGSSTAKFDVTEVELMGDAKDGAHVLSTWTDTNLDGSEETYEIVWLLRKEAEGWAIAGMATKVFDDQEPLILNFEDPIDAQRKREAVDEEIARRTQHPEPVQQAQRDTNPDGTVRR